MSPKPQPVHQRARNLFTQALARPDAERAAFVAAACGDDAALLRRVQGLLADRSEAEAALRDPDACGEQPGQRIDHYKLLEKIGEGGFGTVWMAEQDAPLRRQVALKILKPGVDTRQVVARFETERQALALMDHPNIARVFDGGTTATGRPYFVMELVRGLPITRYCDEAQLSPAQRLGLFQAVCEAVQHAHQKGVIHRDLKPSNVLVTEHDGRPVPKVIDFGVAKATHGVRLTDQTVFTGFRQMLGTPEYMAPEQAGLSGLDIDTRADVYSLGVLLYELLTGTKPFELAAVLEEGYEALLRRIREIDPDKPSTRVSTLGERLLEVCRHRRVHPRAFGRLMRGDLDWIVLKALEKERGRRYATAVALAEDIARHLRHEPVQAGPPSRVYKLAKYVRRHRVGVASGAAIALSLVAGVVAAGIGYRSAKDQEIKALRAAQDAAEQRQVAVLAQQEETRHKEAALAAQVEATEQRRRAEAREAETRREALKSGRVIELVKEMLGSSDPDQVKGKDYTVRQLLEDYDRGLADQLAAEPGVEAVLRAVIARTYVGLGLPAKAEPHALRSLELRRGVFGEDHPRVADSLSDLAVLRSQQARFAEAEALHRQALEMRRRETSGSDDPVVAARLEGLGVALSHQGKLAEAEARSREALAMRRRLDRGESRHVAHALENLAVVLTARGKLAEAEALCEQAWAMSRKVLGERHPTVAWCLSQLATSRHNRGRYVEAEALHRRALELHLQVFGAEHPRVAHALEELGVTLGCLGRHAEAEPVLSKAVEMHRRLLAPEDPSVALSLNQLAWGVGRLRRYAEAETMHREALAQLTALLGAAHPHALKVAADLGVVVMEQGRPAEAEAVLRQALARWREQRGEEHFPVAQILLRLAAALSEQGKHPEAEPTYQEALAMHRRLLGDEHPEVGICLANLAASQQRRGLFDKAEQGLQAALGLLHKAYGDASPKVAQCMHQLADALFAQQKFAEAEPLFRQAAEQRRAAFGDENGDVACSLNNLGTTLLCQGKHAEAEPVLRQAVLAHRHLRHEQLPVSISNLARLLRFLGRMAEAEPLFREAIELARQSLAAEPAGTTKYQCCLAALRSSVTGLADLLRAQGNLGAAEALLTDDLPRERQLSAGDPLPLAVHLASLARVLLLQGKAAAAEPVARECLAIRAKRLPGSWQHWNALALLGRALAGQGQLAEAEPLLAEACSKMRPPDAARDVYLEHLAGLVELYERQGRAAAAEPWRQRLLGPATKDSEQPRRDPR